MAHVSTQLKRSRKRVIVGVVLLLLGLAGGGVGWLRLGGSSPKQAAAPPSPITPKRRSPPTAPAYVGSAACAECHAEIAAIHAQTGHAQTFANAIESEIAAEIDGEVFHDPEWNVDFHYEQDEDGLWATLPTVFPNRRFPLQFALGSAKYGGVSFLTLMLHDSGKLVGLEHRVSWLSPDNQLHITPGHSGMKRSLGIEYFGHLYDEARVKKCLNCHTTTYEIRNADLVNLEAGVNCEACHGPGRKHVESAWEGGGKQQIRFGRNSESALHEIRVCGRCHRLPINVKPDELQPSNRSIVRFQPVGLMQSRCYRESGETLRCSTCHDPHEPASAHSEEEYIRTCLQCHSGDDSTKCSISPTAGCVRCHMPPVDVMLGASFHDHWIRVRNSEDPPNP